MRGGERYLCPACEVPFSTARGGADPFVRPPGQPTGGDHAMTVVHFEAQPPLARGEVGFRPAGRDGAGSAEGC